MPFVTTIFQVLQMPTDERDQVTASEKRLLHHSYFLFIICLLNNNIHDVLANQGQYFRELLQIKSLRNR
jgi:hypothetical protein